jgi:hypothetical protein
MVATSNELGRFGKFHKAKPWGGEGVEGVVLVLLVSPSVEVPNP